jgi:hypothetical protein
MCIYEELNNMRLMISQDETVIWEIDLPNTTLKLIDDRLAKLNLAGVAATRDDLICEALRVHFGMSRDEFNRKADNPGPARLIPKKVADDANQRNVE